MTPEFVESCDKMNRLFGKSAFLCVVCRRLAGKINTTFQEFEAKLADMEGRLKTAELERKILAAKVESYETKSNQVTNKIVGMEKEIESGMEKAKKEVKDEVAEELKEREERSENVVIYGLVEADEDEAERRKEHDKGKMEALAKEIGVSLEGEVEVRFRAGKKREDGKPRPMIVRIEREETRQRLLSNARKLARKEEWRSVFVAHDLTWKQREEARMEEKKLREEADRKTQEAKNGGRGGGRYIVVGQRGRRRVVWKEGLAETE